MLLSSPQGETMPDSSVESARLSIAVLAPFSFFAANHRNRESFPCCFPDNSLFASGD
jgi:hypothetical protein